jgi:tetratricopeptide (TPR) repeat protein
MKVLALCLLLAAPAMAQTRIGADGQVKLDVDEVANETFRLYSEVSEDASFRYLDATIREARGKGWLGNDSGVLFAMYSDALRNMRLNPAYALRIADEGLALVRRQGSRDPRDPLALEVSRAYALADLGRFDEAVAAATLAVPMMRENWGEEAGAELEGYIAEWSAGKMTIQNSSALDLARQALDRAEKAVDISDQAGVLAEASRAMLPAGSGFDAGDLALLNAEARSLAGRALYLLQRRDEARAMLAEGAAALYGEGWSTRPDPQPVTAVPETSRDRIAALFYWLARVALDDEDRPLTEAALRLADVYAPGTDWPDTILLIWMQLAVRDQDHARVDAIADRVMQSSRAGGQEDFARLADFYRATAHASIVPSWDQVDVVALLRATRAALHYATPGSSIDAGHVQGELASFLINTGNLGLGLAYSRGAVMEEVTRRAGDTGPQAEAHAARMRKLAEMHLAAAHALDSRRPDAFCFDEAGRGCVIWTHPDG